MSGMMSEKGLASPAKAWGLVLGLIALFIVAFVLNRHTEPPAPTPPVQTEQERQAQAAARAKAEAQRAAQEKKSLITPEEKEALRWLLSDAKTVFDRASIVAHGEAAHIDLRETHRNLVNLESSEQDALDDLDNKWVPDSLRPASVTLRSAMTNLRKGTHLQLSYWRNGETSGIEAGSAKMKSGLETLNKFMEQTRAFMDTRRP